MKKTILIAISMIYAGISTAYVPKGFGLDMNIQDSLQIIVPKDWGISISKSLVDKKINWNGGVEWREILDNISKNNNITVSYDEDSRSVEVVSNISTISKARKVSKIPYKKKKEIKKAEKAVSISENPEEKQTKDKKSVMGSIKSEISSLFSLDDEGGSAETKSPASKEEKVSKENESKNTPEVVIQDDTKMNYIKITPPKKVIDSSIKDVAVGPMEDKKSFFGEITSEIGSLLSFGDKEEGRVMTKDEINLKDLFQRMKYMVVDLYGYKSTSLRDNTVKFTFKVRTPEGEIDSFIIFNGQSMYSPIVKKGEELIVLDWYSTNYKHPAAVILEPVRPLSTNYKGEVDRVIKKSATPKVYFLDDPSYLEKRKYTIKAGTMLSDAIKGWANMVGVEVVWKSVADFKITKELAFYDGFLPAVERVIKFYNTTKSPYQTRFFVKNKILLVESLNIIYRNVNK